MSFETNDEYRDKILTAVLTDTSDILKIENDASKKCINFFSDLILKEIHSNTVDLKCWIAGGAVRDFYMERKNVTDIDIFFPSPIEFCKVKSYIKSRGAIELYQNENCIRYDYNGKIVELISKIFLDPQTCISNFDFTCCSACVSIDEFYCHKDFIKDVRTKNLKIFKVTNQLSTLSRIQRYIKKGFTLNKSEIEILYKKLRNET